MLQVLIVDDEPSARVELRHALEDYNDIDIVGECGNAIDAMAFIHRERPDVVFLDIQMPQITGIQMLAMLDHATMPSIVFLTAYDEYAVEAFEKNAFDYLLKPFSRDRLEITLQRLRNGRTEQDLRALSEANTLRQIPCFGQQMVYFLKIEDIDYIESRMTGIHVVDSNGVERPTDLPMNILQQRTPLLRCHRQFLINLDRLHKLRYVDGGMAEFITAHGRIIPVSRRALPGLKERLGISY